MMADLVSQWLDSDSIFIPTEDDALTSEAEGSAAPGPSYRLPKLGRRMRELIQGFGGGVFPKLNWTAPRVSRLLFFFFVTVPNLAPSGDPCGLSQSSWTPY